VQLRLVVDACFKLD